MAASSRPAAASAFGRADAAYVARVLRVVSAADFKVKYTDSVLGYVWSWLKPLGMFAVLYVVFGRFFKLTVGFEHYPLYLLLGIVLWAYFADATSLAMYSFTSNAAVLRRLSFPRFVIPLSTTLTTAITFAVNMFVVCFFVAFDRVAPTVGWFLIPLLFVELYLLVLSISLILSTLYVRFRDIGQLWELCLQLLFYASPIIYPVYFLPPWAKPIAFLSPFVQAMQDLRAVIVPGPQITATDVYGTPWGRLLPLAFLLALGVAAVLLYRRESPHLAERS